MPCSCPYVSQLDYGGSLEGRVGSELSACVHHGRERIETNLLPWVNGIPIGTGVCHFLQGHIILGDDMLLDPRLWPSPAPG